MAKCTVCKKRDAVKMGRCKSCYARFVRLTKQVVKNINAAFGGRFNISYSPEN